ETPAGNKSVARTPTGSAPITARSLHTTWTARRPAPLLAVVIGSVVRTTAQSSGKASAAASMPSAAPTSVSGRLAPRRPKIRPRSRSGDSFPEDSVIPKAARNLGRQIPRVARDDMATSDAEQRVGSLDQLGQPGQECRGGHTVDDAVVETQRQRAHRARLD